MAFTTGYIQGNEGNVDLGTKYVTREYLLNVYPTLTPVVTQSSLWSVGANVWGQLGTNNTLGRSSIVQVVGGGTWRKISASTTHSFGIKTDGTLWAWGYDGWGELGLNAAVTPRTPVQVGADTTWKEICSGYYSTAALKIDGTLWTWGNNSYGQLGKGDTVDRSSPVQVGTAGVDGDRNWKQITVHGQSMGGIKTDGTLWTWGYNSDGQLGHNDITDRSSPTQVSGTTWRQVVMGAFLNTYAIKTDGTLWTWGAGYGWAQGSGSNVNIFSPTQIGTATTWKKIAPGSEYSVHAIKTDNTLWGWGSNTSGELGLGTVGSVYSIPVQVGTANDWLDVVGGAATAYAIKMNGTLWSCGENMYGGLGLNDTVDRAVFTQIPWGNGWTAIASNGSHALFLHDSNLGSFSFSPGSFGGEMYTASNVNLRSYALDNGWDGTSALTVVIPNTAVIYSTSPSIPALTISGLFPNGVTISNNGYIVGCGGTGGNAVLNTTGGAGGNGGIAIAVSVPVSISNYGVIGGGGGGGGSGGSSASGYSTTLGNGGGGGAGFGQPGVGNTLGNPGAGTESVPGSGGGGGTAGPGGAGGNLGSAGSAGTNSTYPAGAGGSAGAAVSGNSYITWLVTGTRYGTIA